MRIGYFGSPPISAALLRALLESAEHEIACVVSNPDRPRGRSGRPEPTACSALALERSLPLLQFQSLRDLESVPSELGRFDCDLFVVFAYGRILPTAVIEQPRLGTVNLHGSLLPLLRGASPIQSALLHGFERTGWTLQLMAPELDSGDILAQKEIAIDPLETAGELTERMLPLGIALVIESFRAFASLLNGRVPQDPGRATYCHRLSAEQADIDWSAGAARVHNLVRAFNPWPVARSQLSGRSVRILRTRPVIGPENQLPPVSPGEVVTRRLHGKQQLLVGTGSGFIEVLELQMENRRAMSAADFLNGMPLPPGSRFVSASSAQPQQS